MRAERAHGIHGQVQLLQVGKCLQDEEINASVEECLSLLGERAECLRVGDLPHGHQVPANGAHRPGNERAVACGTPSDLDAGPVDLGDLIAQAVGGQLEAVGAIRIRFDQACACVDILFMDRLHEGWVSQVSEIVGTALGDTPFFQECAHGAVCHQHTLRE